MKTPRFFKTAGVFILVVVLGLAVRPAFAARQEKGPDQDVKAKIEESFKQSGLLLGNDIQVAIANKTVTLTGTVRTLAQREQAGQAAQAAAKGYKITNNLTLASVQLSPREISDGIMAAINQSPSYFVFDVVGVDVTPEGEVTLQGWTSYPWSANDFVKLAMAQPGVSKVNNGIQRPMLMDSDRYLRNRVAQLIYIRPMGINFNRMNGRVHIYVNNGVVTLAGVVEKEADAENYERLVRLNTGALSVVNGLQVRKK